MSPAPTPPDCKTNKCAGAKLPTIYPSPMPVAPVPVKPSMELTPPIILIVPGLTPPIVEPRGIRIVPLLEEIGTLST